MPRDAVVAIGAIRRAGRRDNRSGEIPSPYRRILECTGWLEYVDSNVDVIRYYDFPSFQSASGLAVGLARYENGRRIADVAIKDRPDVDVVTTIVHEAAHLSGISRLGTYLDQDAAHGVETRFLLDARALRLQ
jgi:hypothetical protein